MRLQILNLPAPADEYPFAIVLDEVEREGVLVGDSTAPILDGITAKTGAKAVLVFAETVEIV